MPCSNDVAAQHALAPDAAPLRCAAQVKLAVGWLR